MYPITVLCHKTVRLSPHFRGVHTSAEKVDITQIIRNMINTNRTVVNYHYKCVCFFLY